MAKKKKPELPIAPLPDLVQWWQSRRIRGIIIGGLAVSLLAKPRLTRDIDGLILLPEEAEWPSFLKAGAKFGFLPRVDDVLELADEGRVLLLRHESTGIDIDITLGSLSFEEEAVSRGITVKVAGSQVTLATPEDLVIMKAVANRPQDWLDIEGLLVAYSSLDKQRVRQWTRMFADALDTPEICDELEKRLTRRARGPRKK